MSVGEEAAPFEEAALRQYRSKRRQRSRKQLRGGHSLLLGVVRLAASLDTSYGASYSEDSPERHAVEQQLLSREIRNPLAVGGPVPTGDVKFDGWHSPGSTRPRSPLASLLAAARHVPLCLLTASAWRPIQMPSWH